MGLRAQAVADAKRILEDLSGFGWPLTLISPSGVSASHVGFTTDVAESIDPETGVAVSGRRASVAISLLSLPVLPSAVPESTRRPWVVTFDDATTLTPTRWKVVEVLPDRAIGVVVLLLEAYRLVVVSGTLTLPSLGLTGSLTPRVPMSGALTLPELELEGSLARPVVVLGAAVFTLPELAIAGGIRPVVAMAPAVFTLPSLGLDGGVRPVVTMAGALALPPLALEGGVSPVVTLAGALTWPAPQLAGGITPAVALAGSPTLPHLALAGGVSPAVTVAGALTLPSMRVFNPTQITSLVAHWSGNDSTGASAPNRIAGSTVGALAQATPADQPAIITLNNGIKALSFDGVNSDMKTPDVAALRFTAKGYWAWHLRSIDVASSVTYLFSQWAEGGSTERVLGIMDARQGIAYFYTATSATAVALKAYGPMLAELQAGCWFEVLYDGSLAAASRAVLCVNGIPQAVTLTSGTTPAALLAGDALNYWLGSNNGTLNKRIDVAHHYVGNAIPTAAERAALRAFEAPLWATPNLYVSPLMSEVGTANLLVGSGVCSPNWPSHMIGDIGILLVETSNIGVSATPAGWNLLANQGVGVIDSATNTRLQVFWRRAASGAETSPNMDYSGDHVRAMIITVRGCISTGNPIDVSAGDTGGDVDSTSVVIPGATTTVPNCLVLAVASRHTDSSSAQQSGEVNASLSSLTERHDSGTSTANGGGVAVVTGIKTTAGAYSATTATLLTAARQARVSFALKPNP
jgi:hypothetical protein